MMTPTESLSLFLNAMSGEGIATSTGQVALRALAQDASGRQGALPLAIVEPRNTEQMQRVIQQATSAHLPLIPVSSVAGPRRRGDTISDTQSIIVDLSGMNRVIHISEPEGIAIIEPGVTFPAFAAALRPHGLRPFQPLMPRATKSVLTTFLEREPMTVPGKHWDSADPLAAMEVVFGNGDVFRTGNGYVPGKLEDSLALGNRHMYSLGPGHLDFGRVMQGAQGALGVVAWASIFCQHIPALEVPLFVGSEHIEPLVELAYRQLRRRGAGQLFLLNHVQLALMLAGNAEKFTQLKAALPRWVLYVELSAPHYYPEQAIAYRRALIEADAAALDLRLTEELAGHTAMSLATRQRAYADLPASTRCGLVEQETFFLSQLDKAAAMIAALTNAGTDDCAIYLQPKVHGVNAHFQFTYLGMATDAAQLAATTRRAAEVAANNGAFFSSPCYPWADIAFARDPYIASLLRKTKDMFDPERVLQPGAMSLGVAG